MDKLTFEYQRSQWEAMKKTINDQVKEVKKLNKSDLRMIVRALFRENIIRGRGLLASAIIKAQLRSPSYAPIYAALVSVINTKLPLIGELICKRVISSWRESYISHDEEKCFAMIIFLAHLINQKLVCIFLINKKILQLFSNIFYLDN
jgi:pre-mRNA-splicing factor CWC22